MRRLTDYIRRNSYYFFVIILLGVSIKLIVSHNNFKKNDTHMMYLLVSHFQNSLSYFNDYQNLKSHNEILFKENEKLKSKLSLLKKSNDVKLQNYSFRYIYAGIIKNSYKYTDNYLILNKGRKNGVELFMGVVSNNGVIGIVNKVSENFCSVISILNSYFKLDAKIKHKGFGGTLVRMTNDFRSMKLEDLSNHAIFGIGDTVVTGGNSLIFPKGIDIGVISSYDKNNNVYDIKVSLFEDLTKIKDVFIIKSNFREELKTLEQ